MMLVILSTAIGTFTGVIATVLLMQRKGQFLGSGSDLIARQQVPELERSLANANATVEELRKQAAAQGQILQQNREELERKQQELDAELSKRSVSEQQVTPLVEKVRELTAMLEDEQRQKEELAGWNVTLTAQAGHQNEAVAEQLRDVEAKAAAERKKVVDELEAAKREKEELSVRLRDLEAQAAAGATGVETARTENETLAAQLHTFEAKSAVELETVKREKDELVVRVHDLEAQAAAGTSGAEAAKTEKEALAAQLRELEAKAASERLAVWAELDGVRRENEELTSQLRDSKARADAELEAVKREKEEWAQRHAALSAEAGQHTGALGQQLHALEARTSEERLRFATEIDTLRREKEALEAEVERERAFAAEGMELLSLAHKKFSGVFEIRFADAHGSNGNGHATNGNGHGTNGNGHHVVTAGNGELLPVPALELASEDDAVFAFGARTAEVSEVAGD